MQTLFFTLFLAFACSFSLLFAQNKDIDSLKKVLPTYAESDSNYINTLNELAYKYYTINPDTTFILAERSISLAQQSHYNRGQIEAIRNKGLTFWVKGDYTQALKLYLEALRIAEKIDYQKGIASLYNNMANIYRLQGKYLEALENHFKALKIREEIGDKKGIAASLNNIAIIYDNQGKYAESLENHFKSLKIKEEIGDKKGIAYSLNNMAIIYMYQGKYAEALENHFKSLKIKEEIGDKKGIAYSLNNMALIHEKQGKYPEALGYYFKSIKINEEISDKQGIVWNKEGLAKVYLGLKQYTQALSFAQGGLEIANEIGEKILIRDFNETLSKIYEATGKPDKALFHYKQFKIHADSLNNLERDKKTATLQAQHEFDKKTALMQAEQAKKNIEQNVQKKQLYWLIFSAFAGLFSVLIILFLIFRSRKKIQIAYRELAISNIQIQQTKEEIEVQAEELQKLNHFKDRLFSIIAHDLRSPMATLQGTISILDPDILNKSELETIKTELTKQFEVTDKILQDLLQWTKDQMKGETIDAKLLNVNEISKEKINLFLTIAQHKNITLLSEMVPDTQVFADENHVNIILQNLLSNALKFTYTGGKITIKSQNINKMVQITVKDTGKGMNNEQQSKLFSAQYFTTKGTVGEKGNGLGLHLVKELVEKNGGKIWVTSEEGKGSEFCFLLPVIG
jgi:signal transduction histidine kinase